MDRFNTATEPVRTLGKPTPLEIRWPMRHGDFVATLRIPLNATSSELDQIKSEIERIQRGSP
jgi:hypothetical protein